MNMHTKITPATATLDQLKPGADYPGGNINARLHYTDAEIEELAASLRGPDGQLRPLLVATHSKKPGQFFVFGGGRRRIAFERLIGRGDLPKDHPIEIVSHGEITPAEALSKSFADNQAVPMHPADQAVTFAHLSADRAPEDIARERGMTVRAVQQSIALGTALIPAIIALWREGKLSRENVETLTVADEVQQQETLERIKEGDFDPRNSRDWDELRQHITANKGPEMDRLLGFVGIDAARAAGIEVVSDFFGKGGVVKDLKALQKLAAKQMKGLVQIELDAGWSWSDGKLSVSRGMHHGYGECQAKPQYTADETKRIAVIDARLKQLAEIDMMDDAEDREESALMQEKNDLETAGKSRAYTDKQKSGAGVIIHLREDGRPEYLRGLIRKPAPKAQAKGASPASRREPEAPPLNWDARRALKDFQDNALGDLLVKHPKDVMALLLASAAFDGHDPIVSTALEDSDGKFTFKGFEAGYLLFKKMTPEKMGAALCAMFPNCVEASDYQGKPKKDAPLLIKIVGEKEYQAALAVKFYGNSKRYFDGASKNHMLGVMAEAFGPVARDHAEDKTEAQLRTIFDGEIKGTGWLPPELRTKVYSGPSAKKPAKAAAPAKKKAAR